jgi:hypothetical protein
MFLGRNTGRRLIPICLLGLWVLLGTVCLASASVPSTDIGNQTFFLPVCPPKTSMETQLSDPKEAAPSLTFSLINKIPAISAVPNPGASAQVNSLDRNARQMTAKFQFTPAAELRVSFLYNQDQSSGQSAIGPTSHLLFRYSLDYCIMPTLKVGLSGYLYKPPTDYFASRNSLNFADPVYGFGPGIQYDLGRWSFLLRSQLETSTRERGEALHNWFRVWYAF